MRPSLRNRISQVICDLFNHRMRRRRVGFYEVEECRRCGAWGTVLLEPKSQS